MKTMKFMLIGLVMALALGLTGVVMAVDTNATEETISLTVMEISLLDITAAASPAFIVSATEAGDHLLVNGTADTNDEVGDYLQYTSIVDTEESRVITAICEDVPAGLTLSVLADDCTESGGDGTIGAPAVAAAFDGDNETQTATSIITAIGTCYTGNEATNGHQITYTLAVSATENVVSRAIADITVDYVMTPVD